MLSGLLKSDIAVKVNVQIIDAFVKLRRYVSSSLMNSEMLINHENRILKLETTFNKMQNKGKINTIFFEGQIFDAYVLLLDIFDTAKKEIIIIDNYAGKENIGNTNLLNFYVKRVNGNKLVLKYLKNIDKDEEFDKHLNLVLEYLNQFSYDFSKNIKNAYDKKIADFLNNNNF